MKDFFEGLNALRKPKRRDMIEKDFYLHKLLYQISRDDYLKDNLVFKGGTCQENNKMGPTGSSTLR